MNQIFAALIGGLSGSDGISAYERPLLFSTAGKAVLELLSKSVTKSYFVHGENEKALEGAESIMIEESGRFSALKNLPECAHIIVVAAPFTLETEGVLQRLIDEHINTGYGVSVLSKGYGMARADGTPMRSTEPCVLAAFTKEALSKALESGSDSLDGLVDAAEKAGAQTNTVPVEGLICVKDGASAYFALRSVVSKVNLRLIDKGVHIFDPASTYISPDAEIEPGVTILPGCHIREGCRICKGAVIGPNTILEKANIGAGTTVNSSQVYESKIGENVTVGPFAYVRPECVVGDNCRIGDFVELKKSTIGNNTKVSHLTYIGDASIGERVNFGCGTVVVNYDGYVKSRTIVGDDCFIGCNTNLVSPVELGDRAFTAAGTTVTKNVPAGALAVARSRQTNMEGWNDRRREAHGQK